MRGFVLVLLLGLSLALQAHAEGRKWALLVGIDHYQRSDITALNFAVADVKELAATLRGAGFRADDIFVLTSDQSGDDAPTRTNVAYRLDWLKEHVKPGDTVLFFFSGHGMEIEESQSYLLTVEADARSQSTLQDSSLDTRNLQKRLQALQASHLLLFVDACRSDPHGGGRAAGDNPMRGALSRDLVLQPSSAAGNGASVVATFFACSPGQRSYEWTDRRHGFFTWYLIEGLRGRAATGGRITLPSLIGYLEAEVSKSVERAVGKKQVPFMEAKGSALSSWTLATVDASLTPTRPTATTLPPPRTSAVGDLIRDGQKMLAQRNYRQADVLFNKAAALDDQSAEALAGRSLARVYINQVDAALSDASRAVELDPRCFNAWMARAHVYVEKKKLAEALADYDAALALNPQSALAHVEKAMCLSFRGDNGGAMAEVERALSIDPRCATAYTTRASLVWQRDKRLTAALQNDLDTAHKLDPGVPDIYLWRSVIYGSLERLPEAIAEVTQYTRLMPFAAQGYSMRAILQVRSGHWEEAARDADAAIELDKDDGLAWFARGTARLKLGDQTGGLAAFREAVRIDPTLRNSLPPAIQSRL